MQEEGLDKFRVFDALNLNPSDTVQKILEKEKVILYQRFLVVKHYHLY